MTDLILTPVIAALPQGFTALQRDARAEGHRHLDRLAADWHAQACRFDHPGERLLAGVSGGDLAGIGGITRDPIKPQAFRMRRF